MAEKYYTILTAVGKAKIANAQVLGRKVDITQLAVGDRQYNPSENQTALQSEVWRGNISSIHTDEENPNWIILEAVIPADAGGFNVREVGVFDAEGDLIAVGKYPETYKPILTEGSAKDLYLRMIIEVTNASSVQLKIDPTIAMPSRKWVEEEIGKHANTKASLTQSGHVQLSDAINSTSTTEAATPSAIKKVNDLVIAHQEKIATNETNIEKNEKDIFSMDIRMRSAESQLLFFRNKGIGVTYYVSSSGSNSNNGGQTSPLENIHHALNKADQQGYQRVTIYVMSNINQGSNSYSGTAFKHLRSVRIYGSDWDENRLIRAQRANNGYIDFHNLDEVIIENMSLTTKSSQITSQCIFVHLKSVFLYGGLYFSINNNLNVTINNCKVIGTNDNIRDVGFSISNCGKISFLGDLSVSFRRVGCRIVNSIVTGISSINYSNCEQNLVTSGSLVS